MLKSNAFFKEENVQFLLKRNKPNIFTATKEIFTSSLICVD